MTLPIYQVDAFADKLFSGNPAAICPLENWLSDSLMQQIASENNLSETAFFVFEGNQIHIRWFTPTNEVDLCGHATLASAHILKTQLDFNQKVIPFYSLRSGMLPVTVGETGYTLDFPSDTLNVASCLPEFLSGFGKAPLEVFKGSSDYLLVFESEQDIRQLQPDFSILSKIKTRGFIATAQGETVDFVSRFFAPACGINEDPVTGSAHTTLTPFWAARLHKERLEAIQLSARGGKLSCEIKGNRTLISGTAVLYLKGELFMN
jgi:PhzF family phenazine biosynthesis protein